LLNEGKDMVPEYEAPEIVTYSEEEILQDLVVNCGEFSF